MNRERYLVKSTGDNRKGTEAGFAKLLDLMRKYDEGVIVVPQLKNVEGTLLGDLLNDASPGLATKFKRQRRQARLEDKITTSLP